MENVDRTVRRRLARAWRAVRRWWTPGWLSEEWPLPCVSPMNTSCEYCVCTYLCWIHLVSTVFAPTCVEYILWVLCLHLPVLNTSCEYCVCNLPVLNTSCECCVCTYLCWIHLVSAVFAPTCVQHCYVTHVCTLKYRLLQSQLSQYIH